MKMRTMTHGIGILAIALSGCGSDVNLTGSGGPATVVGSVESTQGAGGAPAPVSPAQQSQGELEAHSVVIGEVTGNGQFTALAEAEVNAQGEFRIEEVPSGRSNLVVRARNQSGEVVGSVILQGETQGEQTHRVQPINARSTLHARVWTEARSTNPSQNMGPAEMALFLDASAHASAHASEQDVEALAEAMIEAQQAISAALSAQGSSLNAEARNEILLAAAVQRDVARDAGASATVSQESYVAAAIQAFGNAGARAEALALAYAAGASVLARAETELDATVHLAVVREALLLNLEARKRAAAGIQSNPIGLRTSAEVTLTEMEARIRSATSIEFLRSSMANEHADIEGRVIQVGFLNLPILSGSVEALVEARLITAVEAAQLWVHLDGAASASAMGSAVGSCRAEVQAAATALIEALPSAVSASISAETVVQLLLILGGGADLN